MMYMTHCKRICELISCNQSSKLTVSVCTVNLLIDNVPKWSDTLSKSCSKMQNANAKCKCKVCLTILGQYASKG